MAGFSTTTTVSNRTSDARLLTWLDKDDDDVVDATPFAQLNDEAADIIRGMLTRKYGEAIVTAWTDSTAPSLIVHISDGILIWLMQRTNPKQSEQARQHYDDAMQMLENLANPDHPLELHDLTPSVDDELYETEVPDSDFDDFED